jgi:hypothetical protein
MEKKLATGKNLGIPLGKAGAESVDSDDSTG